MIWLITMLILALRGKLPPEKALNLEIAALYWHFVDVVWIVIFPVVYLMKLRPIMDHARHAQPTSTRIPTAGTYVKIGLILFVLTALEVGSTRSPHREERAGLPAIMHPCSIPVLLVLSALKFALVAMFYMHLKQDGPLFSGVFVFPLVPGGDCPGADCPLFGGASTGATGRWRRRTDGQTGRRTDGQ